MPSGRVEMNALGPHPFVNAHTHDVSTYDMPASMGDAVFEAVLEALEEQGEPPDGPWYDHIRSGVQFATATWTTADDDRLESLTVEIDARDGEWYSEQPVYQPEHHP